MLGDQNEDGGWGFHIEGHSTMLGTSLNYISMRILGVGPDDEAVAAGRKWILDHGGATYSPSWGKCYLSVSSKVGDLLLVLEEKLI